MREIMGFGELLEELEQLLSNRWTPVLVARKCGNSNLPAHRHLELRLTPPGKKKLLLPLEAVAWALHKRVGKDRSAAVALNYRDARLSERGVYMACQYIDWMRAGHQGYVYGRLKLLETLGVTDEIIKAKARKAGIDLCH